MLIDFTEFELETIANGMDDYIQYDDEKINYEEYKVDSFANKFVKIIIVNKKDLYGFDRFMDKILKANPHDVKVIEDFSDLQADTVTDDIINHAEDTTTLLNKYVDELDVTLDKDRLKGLMRGLYNEAHDLEL